jgi:hypothetical protein
MDGTITVLWQGSWQEAKIVGQFRENEFVARLQSGEEIVVPRPKPEISQQDRLASLRIAGEIFHLEFLLSGDDDILQAPLPEH